jgi:hypothetical protein
VDLLRDPLERYYELPREMLFDLRRLHTLHEIRRRGGKQPAMGVPRVMELTGIALQDGEGRDCAEVSPGQPLNVVVDYQVNYPVDQAAVHVMFFSEHREDWHGFGLRALHSSGLGLRLPTEQPGPGRILFNFPWLGFGPGPYQISVGIWPGEARAIALDVRHGALRFAVPGEPGGIARAPLSWEQEPVSGEARDPRPEDPIGQLTFCHPDGQPASTFDAGAGLLVRALVDTRELPSLSVAVDLVYTERLVHREICPDPLPAGQQTRVSLALDPILLLQGSYMLRLSLVDPQTEEPRCGVSDFFLVRSDPGLGQGLVYFPATAELLAPPREPAS